MPITTLPRNYRWFRAQGITATEAHYLAGAEDLAAEFGWYVMWEYDPDDCADGDEKPLTRERAILYADGYEYGMSEPTALAAHGGICDATDDYRRIIAAELALETLGELPA